jgi:hypothetical protein
MAVLKGVHLAKRLLMDFAKDTGPGWATRSPFQRYPPHSIPARVGAYLWGIARGIAAA